MNKKITVGLIAAAILAGIGGAADAAPNKQSHKDNNNKHGQTVHVVQRNQVKRPTVTPRPQKVMIVQNNNKHHGHKYSHQHKNCNNCYKNSTSDKVLGAVVIGAITGGVLYALAN